MTTMRLRLMVSIPAHWRDVEDVPQAVLETNVGSSGGGLNQTPLLAGP
jgi:hypothetical protein